LLGGNRSHGRPGHRVVLPPPDSGVQQDREPRLLLQRARRWALRRRGAPAQAPHALVAAGAIRALDGRLSLGRRSMKRLTTVQLETPPGESLLNITDRVKAAVRDSGVAEGICVVFVPHTTA